MTHLVFQLVLRKVDWRRMGSQRASPKDCLINWGFRSVLRTADQRWMGSRWPATMAIQKLRDSQKVLTMDALMSLVFHLASRMVDQRQRGSPMAPTKAAPIS